MGPQNKSGHFFLLDKRLMQAFVYFKTCFKIALPVVSKRTVIMDINFFGCY